MNQPKSKSRRTSPEVKALLEDCLILCVALVMNERAAITQPSVLSRLIRRLKKEVANA